MFLTAAGELGAAPEAAIVMEDAAAGVMACCPPPGPTSW
jgi:beta-phosphoglucomutase-like phosphatase (HAD superfamily)